MKIRPLLYLTGLTVILMSEHIEPDYKIIYSARKTLCIEVKIGGNLIIRAPFSTTKKQIEKFIIAQEDWIKKTISKQSARAENKYHRELSKDEIQELKIKAKEYIPSRIHYYSSIMNLTPIAVKITSAKTKFGSCSGKNSINFSYRLMLYPPEAIDYVIVHELAHIKHHNHSKEFYKLIEKYMPDYKEREKILKD